MLSTPLRFLAVLPVELNLATVLKSGQAFRWQVDAVRATRPDLATKDELAGGEEWAMGWEDRTVVLRQDLQGIHYRSLYPRTASTVSPLLADLSGDTTGTMLRAYFQLDTLLAPLISQWQSADPHFAKKMLEGGDRLQGIRVLQQPPFETLFSFICSSNNNIGRITLMLNRVSEALGSPLPHPTLFTPATVQTAETLAALELPLLATIPPPSTPTLYSFPPPSAFTPLSTDPLLRSLGFGYRAPFLQVTAELLTSLAADGGISTHSYLEGLKFGTFEGTLEEVREKLIAFKGVGRKVADCVALFGLGWAQVVPVDTHVFQIAIRDYKFPASKTTALTPDLHNRVAAKLVSLWGPYAGWAQQVLFFADLAVKAPSPTKGAAAARKTPTKPVKAKWEEELDALVKTPVKRKRAQVVKVKVEYSESEGSGEEEVIPSPTKRRSPKKVKVE